MIFNNELKGTFQKKWNQSSPLWITREVPISLNKSYLPVLKELKGPDIFLLI